MSGELISSQRAYELGFVSILFDKVNFRKDVLTVANQIAGKPKSSLIEIRKLISNNYLREKGLLEERKSFYNLLNNENAK